MKYVLTCNAAKRRNMKRREVGRKGKCESSNEVQKIKNACVNERNKDFICITAHVLVSLALTWEGKKD